MRHTEPVLACVRLGFRCYRLWPVAMGTMAALGLGSCWLAWPLSPSWAVTLLVLPHLLPMSIAVHEAGHALAAQLAGHAPETIHLVSDNRSFHVEAPADVRTDQWIAAAGPLCAGTSGLALAVAGRAWRPELLPLSAPFLVHLGGLLPGSSDGRILWRRSAPTREERANRL